MEKYLHIVCLDVPYPVDYGGVFDLFYKLPALQKQGIKIYLHCFEYGRGEQPELEKYCESVYYYNRPRGHNAISTFLPYIVASRKNENLFERLLKDDHPILMEGIHCTYLLNDTRFYKRKCFVRLHNVEHTYYRHLFETSKSITKKIYYWWESKLLLEYEKKIANKATFWAVSEKDVVDYKKLGSNKIDFLPLFLPPWKVSGLQGNGTFCLYHGNLGVAENEKAASWLLEKVFNDLKIPFVVAGKNPSQRLKTLAHSRPFTCMAADPTEAEMQDLVAKAQKHVLPSFNATGIKLKLINALYNGRHCIVNKPSVEGSGLDKACIVVDNNEEDFKKQIQQMYSKPFGNEALEIRHQLLDNMFDNNQNAQRLINWIWEERESEVD